MVSDTDWMNNPVKAFGFPTLCPVKVLPLVEMHTAMAWTGG